MRGLGVVGVLALLGVLAAGLHVVSFSYFKTQEIDRAAARLTLYTSTLTSELRHFAHLPFLLSLDPVVVATLSGAPAADLDRRLARFSQSAGVDAIYLMDGTGLTVSASNAATPSSFKGQSYGFRPYFQAALRGELGEFYGIGATTGIPGYFYALAVRAATPPDRGVIAIKVDLSEVQDNWQASGERIILANDDGVVLLASDPAWRYRTLTKLSEGQRDRIVASRQFGAEGLAPLDAALDVSAQSAVLDGERLLYLQTGNLPNGWTLHFFVPDDAAWARAWLATGAFLTLLLISFSVFQVARVRRIRSALRRSEREETALRAANAQLAVEIEDRRAAEASLQKTQRELERAGRLAALGQLASSVTHELGQPIAAMRNQLAASEMTVGATPLHDKMQGLVARMENITRQLKFFSRKGRDRFEVFDLRAAMTATLDLMEATIAARGAHVLLDDVAGDLTLEGNKMRIEQVMTNLIRNALDAVEDADVQNVTIRMGGEADTVWFAVADTGHGLRGQSFDDLREPFATSRESGRGMGLGLTISAGIVTDHGGTITAQDCAAGGAVFHVTLPRRHSSPPQTQGAEQ
ncbi:C4-dicarboxylate transport sensor protein DctB [Pseudooctadecabacter jejudonensis]|uniref:histidine kinase n=2 Tax=Pseudooctadecabacter jejudonensis TaxID=1391910 RepID=A0A1Y5RWF2_9RHOB|nr:C4-dicarboxylate transport sensor protein DctB [Pseudooctadecabacter jejudonensis]